MGFETENKNRILTQGNSIMEAFKNFEKLNLPPNGATPMKEEKERTLKPKMKLYT